jgi:hypothetical protein
MSDDLRTALHEAAHASVARSFGWLPGPLTVRAGTRWAGCAAWRPPALSLDEVALVDVAEPFVVWPAAVRKRLESGVLVAMAGQVAEQMLAPRAESRQPDSVAERATAALADLKPIDDEDRAWATRVVDDARMSSDGEYVARNVWAMFGRRDLPSANAFVQYAEAQVRSFVAGHADAILRLADVAELAGSMSGDAVAAVLGEP